MATKPRHVEEVAPNEPLRLMLAYLCVATEKGASLEQKLDILDRFGLTDVEISKVCGSKMQSIWNARHNKKGK
jgi:hypothetical protein